MIYGTDAGTQSTGVFGRATSTTAGGGGYYGATGDGGGSSFIMGYAGVRVRDSVGVTQDTNKGFSKSPNFLPVFSSSLARLLLISSIIESASTPPSS